MGDDVEQALPEPHATADLKRDVPELREERVTPGGNPTHVATGPNRTRRALVLCFTGIVLPVIAAVIGYEYGHYRASHERASFKMARRARLATKELADELGLYATTEELGRGNCAVVEFVVINEGTLSVSELCLLCLLPGRITGVVAPVNAGMSEIDGTPITDARTQFLYRNEFGLRVDELAGGYFMRFAVLYEYPDGNSEARVYAYSKNATPSQIEWEAIPRWVRLQSNPR